MRRTGQPGKWIFAAGLLLLLGCAPALAEPATAILPTDAPTFTPFQPAGTRTFTPTDTLLPTFTDTPTDTPTLTETPTPGPVRIMPLGDSLTEGDYPNCGSSFRGYLRRMLLGRGYTNIDFVGDRQKEAHGDVYPPDLDHAGHGNYTIGPDIRRLCANCETTGLYEHVADWIGASQPDVILLLIGLNDILNAKLHAPGYAATAPERMEALLARIAALRPNAVILLASLMQVQWTDGANWPEYQALIAKSREIAERNPDDNIHFVDLQAVALDKTPETDFCDIAHPTGKGAQKIARAWYDALIPFLAPA